MTGLFCVRTEAESYKYVKQSRASINTKVQGHSLVNRQVYAEVSQMYSKVQYPNIIL